MGQAGRWVIASLALTAATSAGAAPPGAFIVDDDLTCSYRATVTFATNSAQVDLSAQGALNAALQWLLDAPGRYLVVAAWDGPRPAEARLGQMRSSAAALFLVNNGAPWPTVLRRGFSDLRATRYYSGLLPYDLALLACEAAPTLPWPEEDD
jgi:outer membrane protein OmpA-like peptidoglycan-associated protein